MSETARICFEDGTLSMPVTNPYEREVFFEQVDLSARRHQHVRLELDRREWLVTMPEDAADTTCAACDQPLRGASYATASHTLCRRCAQSEAVLE